MALTKVTSGMISPDPTDASNLSSGSVPLAQLGNVPASDTSDLEDDIALLGFKVASNGSLSKYNLVDQTEDAFTDAAGIDASTSTGEAWNAAKYFSGVSSTAVTASGGTITTDGDYTIHSFLSGTSNFITDTTQDIDILVVAGGGGGGTGGGGAGGMIVSPAFSVSAGTHSVTVGGGGTAGGTASKGGNGDDSTFPTLTAIGGGGGGKNDSHYPDAQGAQVGGSGGGMGASSNTAKSQGAPGTAGQGNAGANTGSWASPYPANGGGGAGTTGFSGGGSTDGNGGTGLENNYRTGSNVFYAGGGAGSYAGGGTGGSGGGGNSSANGATNTGGGGGGQAAGGSGIVVLRRPTDATVVGNMTLISTSTEAEATPTKGDLVMTYTNGTGTATLNTDLKAYASRDDGTTWTQLTLESQGSTGSHFIVSSHDVDISSQPSDKTMRYKIETLNQGLTKETRIQAVSLGWS